MITWKENKFFTFTSIDFCMSTFILKFGMTFHAWFQLGQLSIRPKQPYNHMYYQHTYIHTHTHTHMWGWKWPQTSHTPHRTPKIVTTLVGNMVLEHNPHLTQSVTATHLIDKSQLQSTLLSISRECCQLDRVLMSAHFLLHTVHPLQMLHL